MDRPRTAPARPGTGILAAKVAPACLGFLGGAIFWHFVGFWDFVSRAVYKDPGSHKAADHRPEQIHHKRAATADPRPRERGGCTTLITNPENRQTQATPCPGGIRITAPAGLTPRGDFSEIKRHTERGAQPPSFAAAGLIAGPGR